VRGRKSKWERVEERIKERETARDNKLWSLKALMNSHCDAFFARRGIVRPPWNW
jgi:hypothetical protein